VNHDLRTALQEIDRRLKREVVLSVLACTAALAGLIVAALLILEC